MKTSTWRKIREVFPQRVQVKLAVVRTSQGFFLCFENTLLPDMRFPVDVFDAQTHTRIRHDRDIKAYGKNG